MTTVQRVTWVWIRCATCGQEGPGPTFIVRNWNGHTYGLACGHEHHLDTSKGGCETWLAPPPGEPS